MSNLLGNDFKPKKQFEDIFQCKNCTYFQILDLIDGLCCAPETEKTSPEKTNVFDACEVFKPISNDIHEELLELI